MRIVSKINRRLLGPVQCGQQRVELPPELQQPSAIDRDRAGGRLVAAGGADGSWRRIGQHPIHRLLDVDHPGANVVTGWLRSRLSGASC